jgi:hypothetical protein
MRTGRSFRRRVRRFHPDASTSVSLGELRVLDRPSEGPPVTLRRQRSLRRSGVRREATLKRAPGRPRLVRNHGLGTAEETRLVERSCMPASTQLPLESGTSGTCVRHDSEGMPRVVLRESNCDDRSPGGPTDLDRYRTRRVHDRGVRRVRGVEREGSKPDAVVESDRAVGAYDHQDHHAGP